MKKQTRNQRRRRERLLERIVTVGAMILLAVCLALLVKQCAEIERMQAEKPVSGPVVSAQTFLPEGFDPEGEAYQAASRRYDVAQGHVMPTENEKAAPEGGTSEAVDTEKSAS